MDCLDYWFEKFSKVAMRLETLEEYAIYDTKEFDEFKKFITNKKIEGFANQDWINDINRWNLEGKVIERIRIIPNKKSDYFNYELKWCYPKNIQSGEQILFVFQEQYEKIRSEIPLLGDFWMFDEKAIVMLEYNDQYEYVGCREINQPEVLDSYKRFYQALKERSVSYNELL
ncbi:DUF6879 family protein [Thomasclavelia cocleata]|uniref:DUF6879 family protein n=1 Tax=Thomasclavelia cocleata TaxID=69824 RepID=UPI00272DF14B|nr:DUF6879 family protein [Thomasclavelia cocleata]